MLPRRIYFELFFVLILVKPAFSQWRMATADNLGQVIVQQISAPNQPDHSQSRSRINIQLREGYPKVFLTHPALKNFRNVTLHDLDDDGADEIILGVADEFMVYRDDEIWWSKKLSGLARFPAAVGDLEGDGILDIVVLTGFNQDDGQVYAFNARGINKPGFPKTFDGHWMISSPALADLDGDGKLDIVCSDLESGLGQVYILRADGSLYNEQWPVTLPNVPAVTPSIGDIDSDGQLDIVVNSTREIYAFDLDGTVKTGWPFNNGLTKFSFQSPILTNLNENSGLEIVTAGHGDLPLFIVLDQQGQPLPNWPKQVPDLQWTFQPPTVISYQDAPLILNARPIGSSQEKPMLFAWRPDGTQLPGFPIVKSGGLEGIITVADIDNDQEPEIIFPSNMIDSLGNGFIHAYELDGTGQVPGFPLNMYGWTFLNGATIGDIDGNGMMDLVVLTYTENPGSERDSALLYVYELNTPINEDRVWWPTYKGDNSRSGLIKTKNTTAIRQENFQDLKLFPNPTSQHLFLSEFADPFSNLEILDIFGNLVDKILPSKDLNISVSNLPSGTYFLRARTTRQKIMVGKFVKI
jgi:hypothetical protein